MTILTGAYGAVGVLTLAAAARLPAQRAIPVAQWAAFTQTFDACGSKPSRSSFQVIRDRAVDLIRSRE